MTQKSNSQVVELPDRREITLCEAVTAFIYGKAYDLRQLDRVRPDEARIKEHVDKLDDLLERLHAAAYAGRIKFTAIKEYGDPADGFEDINRLYFYVKPFFNWQQDVILHREDESSTPWYFVHLDREQFASLLRDMDIAAQQDQDADLTSRTGFPGRPTSTPKHFIMVEAQRQFDAEDLPKTITAFSKELAEWWKLAHPSAAQPTPRSIENAIRDLWHAHAKAHKIIDRS